MYKIIFSFSLVALSSGVWADINFETELRAECAKVKNHAQSGKQFYDQRHYQKAIDSFQQQASWAAFCEFNSEESGVSFSEQAISTAFNNVGLSYAKLGQNGWARAWFSVFPDMKSSQFNLKQLPVPKPSTNLVGEYVSYAGFGAWNTITVKQQKNAYYIEFNGLYMGPRSLIYGPNMGEFETHMPRQSKRALYRLEDCKIELKFGFDVKQGQYIQVDETKNTHCGFGHNVSAYGRYLKVE